MSYIILVRIPQDDKNYHAVNGPWTDQWIDCLEGPFATREDAEDFAAAEVGLPYEIVGND